MRAGTDLSSIRKYFSSRFLSVTIVIAFSILYSRAIAGDVYLGLAAASTDDGPVSYSNIFADPARFANDIQAQNMNQTFFTSYLRIIPGFLLKLFSLDPIIFHTIALYVQNISLVIGIFYLALYFTKNDYILSLLATIFFSNLRPHFINFAWMGGLDHIPYTTWSSLSWIVISLSFLFRGRYEISSIFLFLAVLAHPSMGANYLLFILIYLVASYSKISISITRLILYFFLPSVFWYLVLLTTVPKEEVSKVYVDVLKSAMAHWNAWNFNATTINESTAWLVFNTFFLLLFYFYKSQIGQQGGKIIYVTFISQLIGILLAIISWQIGNLDIMRASFLRITIISQVIFFTMQFLLLNYALKKKRFFLTIMLLLSIVMPTQFLYILFSTLLILIKFFYFVKSKIFSSKDFLFFFTFLPYILSLYYFNKVEPKFNLIFRELVNFFLVGDGLKSSMSKSLELSKSSWFLSISLTHVQIVALVLLVFMLFTLIEKYKYTATVLLLSISIGISSLVVSGKTFDTNLIQSPLSDLKTLQLWIQKNTLKEKEFIATNLSVWESWRNLTNRPKILETGYFNQYIVTEQNYDYNQRLSKWYETNVRPDLKQAEAYLQYYDNFSNQFGGNYLVLFNSGDLDSEYFSSFTDYQNDSYVIINLDSFRQSLYSN